MLEREPEYRKAIAAPQRKIHARILTKGNYVMFTSEEIIRISLHAESGLGEDFTIGGTIPAEAEISLAGFQDYFVEGNTLKIEIGPQKVYDDGTFLENDEIYFKPMGTFIVRKVRYLPQENQTKLEVSDKLGNDIWSERYGSILSFTTSPSTMLRYMCVAAGMSTTEYWPATDQIEKEENLVLPSSAYKELIENLTLRECLSMLAQKMFCFVVMNRYGVIEFKKYAETPFGGQLYLIEDQIYLHGAFAEEKSYKIDSVRVIVDIKGLPNITDVYEKISKRAGAGNVGRQIKIFNRLISTISLDVDLERIAEAAYKINSARPGRVKWKGDPAFEIGDTIGFSINNTEPIVSGWMFVDKLNLEYNGGLVEEVSLELNPDRVEALDKPSQTY